MTRPYRWLSGAGAGECPWAGAIGTSVRLGQSVFTVVTHRGELHTREVCACTHTHAPA